jgi:L-tartrate/succinate antiporter
MPGETMAEKGSPAAPIPRRRAIVLRALLPVLVGAALAALPPPQGLTPGAWRYFALFAAVIVGVITEPIPTAAVGFTGLVLAAASGLVEPTPAGAIRWALSGFSNTSVWLIFTAFMFTEGYARTGLGKRIALTLVRLLGRRTLGLGYATALADLVLAPFTPSNTARSGGTIYPIIKNIPPLYDSLPDETAGKMGSYLLYTGLAATCVTSTMFVTGLSSNILAVSLIQKTVNVSLSWTEWFLGYLPVGIVLFVAVPVLLYLIYPPEIKRSPEAPRWAAEELRRMGPMTAKEYTLSALVLVVLALWIGGGKYMDTTMVGLVAVAAMVVLGIVSWDDVLGSKQAWNVLVWFATLVTLAGGLAQVKFVDWLGKLLAPRFAGLGTWAAVLLLAGAFFVLHYLFASITAHVTALLPVFITVAVTIPGLSPKGWALVLGYMLGIMGILTPYATGPSPIYYGSGYIRGSAFWIYGAALGGVFFVASVVIGVPWLRFLGF